MGKTFNIALVGLYDDDNLGDLIIYKSVESLYGQSMNVLDLNTRKISLNYPIQSKKPTIVQRIICKIKKILACKKKVVISASDTLYIKDLQNYYTKELRNINLVIFVGGGLIKYQYQFCCWGSVIALLNAANDQKIPVWFNAVGVEGYDENFESCQKLKKALHLPCLKKISVRDDIDTLIGKYFDNEPTCECVKVVDTAVWASEVYGVVKHQASDVIGIGIGNANLFVRREIKSKVDLEEFYTGIIQKLHAEGRRILLFTNGAKEDNAMALKVLEKFRNIDEIDIILPENDRHLVQIISSCKGVIAARLHSCIIAYSLNIPCVGMVWNDKIAFFGKDIGYQERFLKANEMQAQEAVVRITKAICDGYDKGNRDRYRNIIKDHIDANIKEIKMMF